VQAVVPKEKPQEEDCKTDTHSKALVRRSQPSTGVWSSRLNQLEVDIGMTCYAPLPPFTVHGG